MRRFLRDLWSFSEASRFQVEEIRAVGGRVLAFFVLTTRGRKSEVETSVEVRRAHIFVDRAEALEAVGLSE